jgi:hypothetical protein
MEYSLILETPAIQVTDPKFPVARARSAVLGKTIRYALSKFVEASALYPQKTGFSKKPVFWAML